MKKYKIRKEDLDFMPDSVGYIQASAFLKKQPKKFIKGTIFNFYYL